MVLVFRTTLTAAVLASLSAAPALAATVLDGVGTYEGSAGIGSSNGDVTDSPAGSDYVYVTTADSDFYGAGLAIGDETNGSELTTLSFAAEDGDNLNYYFNYVASDGTSSYIEYAYAFLNVLDPLTNGVTEQKLIFHARTNPTAGDDTVPGFGLPPLDDAVTLNPVSTPILPGSGADGAPVWSELGDSSGDCFGAGCGLTGWILATLGVDAGLYSLTFGVVNWGDEAYQNGLAIGGLTIGAKPIFPPKPDNGDTSVVPLPAAGWMLLAGLGGLVALRRRKSA